MLDATVDVHLSYDGLRAFAMTANLAKLEETQILVLYIEGDFKITNQISLKTKIS